MGPRRNVCGWTCSPPLIMIRAGVATLDPLRSVFSPPLAWLVGNQRPVVCRSLGIGSACSCMRCPAAVKVAQLTSRVPWHVCVYPLSSLSFFWKQQILSCSLPPSLAASLFLSPFFFLFSIEASFKLSVLVLLVPKGETAVRLLLTRRQRCSGSTFQWYPQCSRWRIQHAPPPKKKYNKRRKKEQGKGRNNGQKEQTHKARLGPWGAGLWIHHWNSSSQTSDKLARLHGLLVFRKQKQSFFSANKTSDDCVLGFQMGDARLWKEN